MQSERLIVKCVTANNCFVYLPKSVLRKLEAKERVIEISHKNKTFYVSSNSIPNNDGSLYIATGFARVLGIEDGDEVFVSFVRDTPSVTSITVTPHDQNDREILEIQFERIQLTLLNQIRVVARNQPIVIWVSKFSSITVTTDSLEPNFAFGKLEQFTEVHVKDARSPPKIKERIDTSSILSTVTNNLCGAFKKLVSISDVGEAENEQSRVDEILQSHRNKSRSTVFRALFLPRKNSNDAAINIARQPYNVFVPKRRMQEYSRLQGGSPLFNMKKLPRERDYVNAASTNFLRMDDPSVIKLSAELVVRLLPLEDFVDDLETDYFDLTSSHNVIYVSDSVAVSLGLEIGSKVILNYVESSEDSNRLAIELFPCMGRISAPRFEKYLKRYAGGEGMIVNSGAAFIFDNFDSCLTRLTPRHHRFAIVKSSDLSKMTVSLRDIAELPKAHDLRKEPPRAERIALNHLKNVLSECRITLDLSLALNKDSRLHYDRENILICGDTGSGKSTVCKLLRDRLECSPFFVHTHTIDCRSLKGKKVEVLQKYMAPIIADCVYYQPSVLFLDDIESITSASADDEETTPDAVNAARIADMLVNTARQYQESHYVSIIATCTSVNRIGQKLRPARGSHFFRTVLSIPNLEKANRIDILRLTLGDKLCVSGDLNWDYYGNKTEGWMVQDLVDMAQKAIFAAWKRHEGSVPPVVVEEEDLNSALINFTPMSLEGIQLFKGAGHKWSDIGGLAPTKQSLVEILQWPLKYPEIFKNAPIKLQNGVLLYGMPGTGKTMLAKAIATECGVNLISVKGPELLSKYIGVSEESVRNIFDRARRAKPCVLFFDEFDSLAPRRGHDSTGVTDRVVNQLLTQLDGVEDREGVAVVAASSRPDLLDPALLRPGRLDKALYCPLPTEVDRRDILLAICHSQKVETAELDLEELAALSPGFTGADLSAAVTQARLSAYEDAAALAPEGKVEAADIRVTQKHLLDSVGTTHPSLSRAEKTKYEGVYSRFFKGDSFAQDLVKNQKATLA